MMKRPKRRGRKSCGIGVVLALVAFLGAAMCVSIFSIKVLLFVLSIQLIKM